MEVVLVLGISTVEKCDALVVAAQRLAAVDARSNRRVRHLATWHSFSNRQTLGDLALLFKPWTPGKFTLVK